MLITPAMIPHDQFHLGIWMTSVENPCWYYFSKRKNTNIISNDSFIETVDIPLRKLVEFLHDHTIRTTPSCSGHYKHNEHFRKIYSALENDRQKIIHTGLLLKDVETGKTHLFQDKNYKLPWNEEEFINRAVKYQQRGVLGMKLGNKLKLRQRIQTININGVSVIEKNNITLLIVEQKNLEQNLIAWAKITDNIEEAFSHIYRPTFHV